MLVCTATNWGVSSRAAAWRSCALAPRAQATEVVKGCADREAEQAHGLRAPALDKKAQQVRLAQWRLSFLGKQSCQEGNREHTSNAHIEKGEDDHAGRYGRNVEKGIQPLCNHLWRLLLWWSCTSLKGTRRQRPEGSDRRRVGKIEGTTNRRPCEEKAAEQHVCREQKEHNRKSFQPSREKVVQDPLVPQDCQSAAADQNESAPAGRREPTTRERGNILILVSWSGGNLCASRGDKAPGATESYPAVGNARRCRRRLEARE